MSVLDKGIHPRAVPARMREVLEKLYPQKASAAGEKAMKQLARTAVERAKAQGAKSARPALIGAIHAFVLGSGYQTDPCYPWTGATLGDVTGGLIGDRFNRMHQVSLDYLERSFQFKG